MLTSRDIRQQFIDFFVKKHGHTFVPSSPVVPHDDPTLLFTNAGMNQFKPYFLGTQHPPYPRAANTQKCIRAGGKHNDLEDVGKDTYHHTFFEMLGNWSFGDYFKKEAIAWAWELLVDVWGLDKTRLHATYFQGDASEGLEPDTEARDLWLQFLPAERVHPGNKKDNFWEMGDTGPCGPCSEIHIDLTPGKDGGKLVNAGDARVMEIWNLVFIQFNRAPGIGGALGKLTPLPAKHVDTGMGFERICSVIQQTGSNYDTDVFTPIFKAIQEVTKARPYTRKLDDAVDTAYRVIADHIRTLTFALTDGAHVTNEGRGYVLRRILRRAVRHGWQTLNLHEPFLYRIVPAVVEAMGDAFPELKKNPQAVIDQIKEEEQSFARTLDRGISLFEEAAESARVAAAAQRRSAPEIAAEAAFKLHDTYGFPLDLTQVMAEERSMTLDVAGFEKLMEQARETARAGGASGGDADETKARESLVAIVQRDNPPATKFLGYDKTAAKIAGFSLLYRLEGPEYKPIQHATAGEKLAIILPETVFYAESGGQVGDIGAIINSGGGIFRVQDTIKVGDVFFHLGIVERGPFLETKIGGTQGLDLRVDEARRDAIMSNHTTTHVMNRALRLHVSPTADQRGSLVDEQKLRFDFSHNAAVTAEQIERVEKTVNDDIAADLPVYTGYAPQEQALKIHGLRAVFGEKYPPKVRVVSIGVPPEKLLENPGNPEWAKYSIEFCGGTHLAKTGDAEGFVIVHEEAVGKGLRRITALTGPASHEAAARGDMLINRLASLKNSPPAELATRLAELSTEIGGATLPATVRAELREGIAALQKVVKDFEKQKSKESSGDAVEAARKIAEASDGPVIVAEVPGADGDALRAAMDVIRKKKPDAAILLGAAADGKVSFVAAVPESLIKKGLKAGDWVKEAAKVAGGGGGGRPDMAQAGGKDPAKLGEALVAGRKFAGAKV